MNTITVNRFVDGVYSICESNPSYKKGHDGTRGKCDNIGLIRGALMRGGATGIRNMKDINQFADTLEKRLVSKADIGDILLKKRFKKFYDIGVVVNTSPYTVVHMTKRGIREDNRLSKWDCACTNPFIAVEKSYSLKEGAKLYDVPNFDGNFITVRRGTKVSLEAEDGAWSRVRYGNYEMYVLTKFIADDEVDMDTLKQAYELIGEFLKKHGK